ncbi:MAG TPA: sugar O-acetyltransferase [Emticicia sp.]
MGEAIDIQTPFYCDYGSNIFAGENLFINFNCTILDCARVIFGTNVFLAPNVQIYTAYHPIIASERIKGPELASPVTIGDNVWLGGGVIICPGVNIGSNTTIGAGSVVTKNIPANVVAAGNPCRVIREL